MATVNSLNTESQLKMKPTTYRPNYLTSYDYPCPVWEHGALHKPHLLQTMSFTLITAIHVKESWLLSQKLGNNLEPSAVKFHHIDPEIKSVQSRWSFHPQNPLKINTSQIWANMKTPLKHHPYRNYTFFVSVLVRNMIRKSNGRKSDDWKLGRNSKNYCRLMWSHSLGKKLSILLLKVPLLVPTNSYVDEITSCRQNQWVKQYHMSPSQQVCIHLHCWLCWPRCQVYTDHIKS